MIPQTSPFLKLRGRNRKDRNKKTQRKIGVIGYVFEEDCFKLDIEEVRKLVKKFKIAKDNDGWKLIEKELIKKRDKWFEQNKKFLELKGSDVEKAYRLILIKIGIDPNKAPIVEKTKKRIVFHSQNFCPTLQACKILNLDTKKVCKEVFEIPTDRLVKKINTKLKFSRNYCKIRPYTNYCEESIELID